ncbi:MAG: HD domain-containing protein [Bacteroides sp.]|nr:HD domain-containing protein [Bacteroides sp.]
MKPTELLKLLALAEKLKCDIRHSSTSTGRPESVAEHCWRLSLMAYFVQDEFPQADINKIILMAIFHDLGEAITGDIPAFEKTDSDEGKELEEVMALLHTLPEPYRNQLVDLFVEMNELQTLEAKIYKALDKMEAVLQHNEADISTWLPLEYDLNLTYGWEETEFSGYMKELREEIFKQTQEKIAVSAASEKV